MSVPSITPEFIEQSQFPFRRVACATGSVMAGLIALLILQPNLARGAFASNYLPHMYCYLAKPGLIWTHVVADSLIGIAYVAISSTLAYLIYTGRREIPFRWMFLAFGLFIVACGGTHFMEVVTVWIPVYVFAAGVKIFTAVASVATAVVLPSTVPQIVSLVRKAKASENHKWRLEAALNERNFAQKALRDANDDLERRVDERTAELGAANRALQEEIENRKRGEARLAQMASIVEFSNDAIVAKTLDGKIATWNKAAERIYGYRSEEVIGQPISILVPNERLDEVPAIMARVERGENISHFETVRATKDGRMVDVSLTVSPIRNPLGAILGISAITRDITERKRAERALRESEEQYRLLFDSSPVPMWVFDRKTFAFLAVNEAAVQHYGFSRQEFLAMTILDIRPEEDIDPLLKATATPAQGLQSPEVWRHRKKDGTIIDVEITSHDLLFHGREAELILTHDITEQRRNEANLRLSEERFSKAFRSSPLAITIVTQAEGRYVDINDAYLEMLGYERDEVIGRTSTELRIWGHPGARDAMVGQFTQHGRVRAFETELRTKSGEARQAQVAAERIELGGVPCILAMIHDITQTKLLEEQFRQAQKMEAVGRLAGGVAHDFNNMLGVIIGFSDLSRDHLDPESPARKHVDQIEKAARRATELTRQLLAFSRQQVLQPRVLNLNALVNNVSKMLVRVVGEDISLNFVPAAPLGSIKADLGQIEQVLMNLVINARDAMPRGGRIIIETANFKLDESYVRNHPSMQPGAYVMLSVTDTGCGMHPKTMSRIFDPFFTTKPLGEGTGLGLSMVYGVVKQSGGNVWVYSELGKGTSFKMYFPRVNEAAEPLVQAQGPVVFATGFETILLVEDDVSLRELTRLLLESGGYKVLEAKNSETAIESFERSADAIHLLLTDVIMPGTSGPEIAARLQQSQQNLKVLYMSGYTGDLIAHHGILKSNTPLLQKPFTKQSLLSEVRTTLDRSE
jgi:PAS domain S-box-containing protein